MTKLPDTWNWSTIGEVADIVRGVTYSKGDTLSATDSDAVPLLRATNLEVDSIDFEDMVYVPKRVVKAQQYLQLDDIFLAASSGSISVVGKSAQVVKTSGETFGAFCAVIRPKNINPKFLAYWVQSPAVRDHWSATAKGTNINNLKPSDISETDIPLPPIEEQNKIVELLEDHLSRLDAALADVKQAKLKAAQFRRSLLQAAFTGNLDLDKSSLMTYWKTCKLSDVVDLISGFAYKSTDWKESGVPVLKITNVRNGRVRLEGCSFITEKLADETINFQIKKGDLLITLTGEIGATGFYSEDFEARLNQRVGKIIPKSEEDVNLRYVAYFLESPLAREIMWSTAKGIAQANISPKEVLGLDIPLPSIDEQNKIVELLEEHLSRLEASVSLADSMEKQSNLLRRSLLQAAFTGQLTKEVVSV